MKTLLLVAHGSRNPDSNARTRALVERIRPTLDGFERVEHAFLEFAEPGIAAAARALISSGAREIILLPYFLAPGNHVSRDIPGIVQELAAQHPQVTFSTMAHIGAARTIPELILEHVRQQEAKAI